MNIKLNDDMGNANITDNEHTHSLQEFAKWKVDDVAVAYDTFTATKIRNGKRGDMSLSRREFWETFTNYNRIVCGEFLSLPVGLFNFFDINGKEKVHALEVFVVLAIHCAGNVTDKIEYCFKLFDFDNSNTISQTEMVMLCRSLTRGLAAIGGISDIPSYQVLEEISCRNVPGSRHRPQ